jgi:hypothetical protein
MARVLLIHWNEAEAGEKLQILERAGFDTSYFGAKPTEDARRRVREIPPDAGVIDLNRQPSLGRDLAIHLRSRTATRSIVLIFIEGDPEKTAHVRSLLPDATFTSWPRAAAAIKRALKNRTETPVVPGAFAGYSGTPLPKKLRITESSVLALLNAPDEFEARLEPLLPPGVPVQKRADGATVILAFFDRAAALERTLAILAPRMASGRTLWLIWPKKTSGVPTDLSEPKVRELGLACGLVDYKICAIDETWSGMAFALRK